MWSWIMKRRRRNKNQKNFYMGMSMFCLIVLFVGFSFVNELSEKRKAGQDVTTISINYDGEKEDDKLNPIDKIMSYFNIFLEKTFKESEDSSSLIESGEKQTAKDVFKTINTGDRSKDQPVITSKVDAEEVFEVEEEMGDVEAFKGESTLNTKENKVYLATISQEDFFRVIESPTYNRSSAPRDIFIDAASINDKFNIVLFHTHGTEAFLPHEEGNYRTQDERYNVMGVGTKIAANLQGYGINVIHLKNYNDYPDYNKSYFKSREAVTEVLSSSKKNLIIDLHRDGAEENSNYEQILAREKTVTINDKTAATCTLVIGDKNDNTEALKENAQLFFDMANEKYPGLFRGVIVRPGAYFNQYLSDNAMLLEIGSNLNHIDEVNYSAELLSDVLVDYIEEISK